MAGEVTEVVHGLHEPVFGPCVGVLSLQVLADEPDGLLRAVELYPAADLLSHACQSFEPSEEARLILRLGWHCHDDAPQRVCGHGEVHHDHLARHVIDHLAVEETDLTVELLVVGVQPDNHFRGVVLLEGMDDAVGDIHRQTALRLHPHIGRDGDLGCLGEHLPALLL